MSGSLDELERPGLFHIDDESLVCRRRYLTAAVASFGATLHVEEVVVRRGKDRLRLDEHEIPETQLYRAKLVVELGNPRSIMLLDGPAGLVPKRVKLVYFTSPNASWFSQVSKSELHATLYMPLWKGRELNEAAQALQLELPTEQMIDDRFRIFGGLARQCLAKDTACVPSQQDTLECTISNFDDKDTIKRLIQREQAKEQYHHLVHYIPTKDAKTFTIRVASKYLERLLIEAICSKEFQAQELSHRIPEAVAFSGCIFETHAHERLVGGDSANERQLESEEE